MVLIKATLRNVARRFSIADDATLLVLKTKVKEVFPELTNVSTDSIEIYYRDFDGDLITVSSDEELKTAESCIGEDKTLKVILDVSEEQKGGDDEDEDEDLLDIIGSLFTRPQHHYHPHHVHSPFGHSSLFPHASHFSIGDPFSFPTWSDRRRMLERHEERLRRQREYEEGMRRAHIESIKKMKEKAEEEKKKAQEKGATGGGEVQRRSSKPVVPVFPPGWHVTPYGSWDPVAYQTPYGSRQVWGPWGYTATFGDDDEKKEEEIVKKGEPEGEKIKEAVPEGETIKEAVPEERKMEWEPKP